MTHEGMNDLVIDCLREVAEQERIELGQVSRGTKLFGQGGLLDSAALVNLIVSVEEAIDDRFSVAVTPADDRAVSQKKSPFRTVEALAEYAGRCVDREREGAG